MAGPATDRTRDPVGPAQSKTRRRTPQGNAELMTEKKVLGFKLPPQLEQSATNIPSACKTANIAQNDAMILSYDANLGRMEYSEGTPSIR